MEGKADIGVHWALGEVLMIVVTIVYLSVNYLLTEYTRIASVEEVFVDL